jgi:uncharacterized membrane protein YeiB
VYIDSLRGFLLVGTLGLHISCFNQINPSLCYLLILYHRGPLMFNSLRYSKLYYIHIKMSCFNIFHLLTFSFTFPASHSPLRQTH